MRGVLYIDSHGYRGYCNNFIEYLNKKCKVIGGEFSLLDFNIKDDSLYYKNELVDLNEFSHVFFCYRCDMIDEPIKNEKKQPHLSGFNFNYFKNLEDFFINNTDLIILNKVRNSNMDYDRIKFFEKMNDHNINIPEYQILYDKKRNLINEKIDFDSINIKLPFLIRTNCDYGGLNMHYISKKEDFDESFQKLLNYDLASDIENKDNRNKVLLATKFYETYNDNLQCRSCCRVILVKSEILCYCIECHKKDSWIYKINNFKEINHIHKNRLDTRQLEHFTLALNDTKYSNLKEFQTESYKFLINYVKKYEHIFKNLYHIIGLDTFSVDFLSLEDGPIILECGIKQGLSYYKVDLIKNNIFTIKEFEDYTSDEFRNNLIYNNLFKKEVIYCDIDNTICNNLKRLEKYFKKDSIDYKLMKHEDIINDEPIIDSIKYINELNKNYKIKFISARNRIIDSKNITEKWLKLHNYKYDELIIVDDLKSKYFFLKNKKFYLFIDDFKINNIQTHLNIDSENKYATETLNLLNKHYINYKIFEKWDEIYNHIYCK